MTIVTLTVT